jgi:hypothetical protein
MIAASVFYKLQNASVYKVVDIITAVENFQKIFIQNF